MRSTLGGWRRRDTAACASHILALKKLQAPNELIKNTKAELWKHCAIWNSSHAENKIIEVEERWETETPNQLILSVFLFLVPSGKASSASGRVISEKESSLLKMLQSVCSREKWPVQIHFLNNIKKRAKRRECGGRKRSENGKRRLMKRSFRAENVWSGKVQGHKRRTDTFDVSAAPTGGERITRWVKEMLLSVSLWLKMIDALDFGCAINEGSMIWFCKQKVGAVNKGMMRHQMPFPGKRGGALWEVTRDITRKSNRIGNLCNYNC